MFKNPRLYNEDGNLKVHLQLAGILALDKMVRELERKMIVIKMLNLPYNHEVHSMLAVLMQAIGRPLIFSTVENGDKDIPWDELHRMVRVIKAQAMRITYVNAIDQNALDEQIKGGPVKSPIDDLPIDEKLLLASILSGEYDEQPLDEDDSEG